MSKDLNEQLLTQARAIRKAAIDRRESSSANDQHDEPTRHTIGRRTVTARTPAGSTITPIELSLYDRIRLWWWRRGLHGECVQWQCALWRGDPAPFGACDRCSPRIWKILEFYTPTARALP